MCMCTLYAGRECLVGNFSPCHYYPCMCTRPRAQLQTRKGWKGLHLSCSQTIQKHCPYVETSCIRHRLRLPATWPVPCTAPGPECTARGRREWSQGDTGEEEQGESRLSTAQPADCGFGEQVRAMVSLGLPSHHIARSQGQMSFGHVRKSYMTSYY